MKGDLQEQSATWERQLGAREEHDVENGEVREQKKKINDIAWKKTSKEYEAAKTNQLSEQRERLNETKVHEGWEMTESE